MKEEAITNPNAEKVLRTIANIVLIAGSISFAIAILLLFTSDLFKGFRLIAAIFVCSQFIYAIAVWGTLTVLSNISNKLNDENNRGNWESKFLILILSGDKTEAKKLLFAIILSSNELVMVLSGGREDFHKEKVNEFYTRFGEHLKLVDINEVDFELIRSLKAK